MVGVNLLPRPNSILLDFLALKNLTPLPMGETVNIKTLADKVAAELFGVFRWEKCEATDYRWTCVELKKHAKQKNKQHPSDVVFRYSDPYRGETIYINSDLKSYSAGTVATFDLEGTLEDLAKSLECAHKSSCFSEAFGVTGSVEVVEGMLFLYNHDGEYQKDFDKRLQQLSNKSLSLVADQRIYILMPDRITYLHSVAHNIRQKIAELTVDNDFKDYDFYSPDLRVSAVKGKKHGALPIEFMVGPWMFVSFRTKKNGRRLVIYLDANGDTPDDFTTLFDAIISYNLLDDDLSIEVVLQKCHPKAPIHFESARSSYAKLNRGKSDDSLSSFEQRLAQITFATAPEVKPSYIENEMAIVRDK